MVYIMSHAKDVYPVIKEHYENVSTRKNMLTPILSLFRVNAKMQQDFADVQKQWRKYHDDIARGIGEEESIEC